MTRRRMLSLAALALLALLLPGWEGTLEEAAHEDVLDAARSAAPGDVFGVARPGDREGEEWHAQYHGSTVARLLHGAGMGASLTRLIPPSFAAHMPVGAERADGYFRVRTAAHWPWWWSGGGVSWSDPRLPADASEE